MAINKWRLQRGPFLILTDHKSLCALEEQPLGTELQRKAMAKLVGLQFKFQYRKGNENGATDSLSRVGHLLQLHTISSCCPDWIQEVLNSYEMDLDAQKLLTSLAVSSPNNQGYSLEHGIIKYHGRMWIGANLALRTKLISNFHATAIGGHSGILATYHRVKKLFYWLGLKQGVEDFVKHCSIYQQAKHEHTHPQALCSHYRFRTVLGRTSPWTSLRVCPSSKHMM